MPQQATGAPLWRPAKHPGPTTACRDRGAPGAPPCADHPPVLATTLPIRPCHAPRTAAEADDQHCRLRALASTTSQLGLLRWWWWWWWRSWNGRHRLGVSSDRPLPKPRKVKPVTSQDTKTTGAPCGPTTGAPQGPTTGAPEGPYAGAPTGAPEGPITGAPEGPYAGAPEGPTTRPFPRSNAVPGRAAPGYPP